MMNLFLDQELTFKEVISIKKQYSKFRDEVGLIIKNSNLFEEPHFCYSKRKFQSYEAGRNWKNSFLEMHLDFNYHPLQKNWYRELNLLLYLNKDWKPEYKGNLRIKDLRTNEESELDVPFNRLIIQQCAPYTLHGYDMTNFPEGKFRTSIATYAYQIHNKILETPRTTDWFPKDDASFMKKVFAKNFNFLVLTKNKFFGSGTAKNQ